MKEIQSLALDMSVQSEEGGVVEVREEDDELLRAAEELGIDLRRPARPAAEAGEPTQAGVDRRCATSSAPAASRRRRRGERATSSTPSPGSCAEDADEESGVDEDRRLVGSTSTVSATS